MRKKLQKIYPDNEGMKMYGNLLTELLPEGLGFTLIVFPFGEENLHHVASYISNANREDMIKFLEAKVDDLKRMRDFQTPNSN